jgi:peptidoglycan/LPS O-acetylase OafA/YrhL
MGMGSLRLGLALLVAVSHLLMAFPTMPPAVTGHGGYAVRAFFVLSGFYMAATLSDNRYRSPGHFYVSRLAKLLPVYWLVTILTFALEMTSGGLFAGINPLSNWRTALATGGFSEWQLTYLVTSIGGLIGADTWMWVGIDPSGSGSWNFAPAYAPHATSGLALTAVPQAWSIGLELCFYFVAPFLVRKSTGLIGALLIGSIVLRLALRNHLGVVYARSLFPLELVYFAAGILGYGSLGLIRALNLSSRTMGILAFSGLGISAALEMVTILGLGIDVSRLMTVVGIVSYGAFAFAVPLLFLLSANVRIDAAFGALSYPVYIAQFLAFGLLYQFVRPLFAIPWWWGIFPCLGVLLLVAWVLDRAVARPIDRLRQLVGARGPSSEVPSVIIAVPAST